jgi:hypothetical protein
MIGTILQQRGTAALAVFLAVSVMFLLLGLWSRTEQVLGPNQCRMTYTSLDNRQVPVHSSIRGPRLLKFSNALTKKLNKQPVLFVPGHQGRCATDVHLLGCCASPRFTPTLLSPCSFDQVRSLSSTMHNDDDFFQYFTLDFQGADTAYHGSSILTQAVFVNDAIRAVQELYQQARPGARSPPRVMVVAHSLGGIVARTAVLLSNHPVAAAAAATANAASPTDVDAEFTTAPDAPTLRPCAVSDIVMLSSPNHRAPYAPDPSLEALFNAVNRAWQASLNTQSKACISAAYRHAQLGRASSSNGSANSSATVDVTADWQCSHCAARIRLVSISGGSLDNLVHAQITRVDGLAPPPRNLTHERTPEAVAAGASYIAPILNLLNPLHWLATALGKGLSGLAGQGRGSNSTGNSSSSTDSSGGGRGDSAPVDAVEGVCEAGGACALADNTTTSSNSSNSGAAGGAAASAAAHPLSAVTAARWAADVAAYDEPQHLSLLTTQLADVGFPVDHKAVLWCHQLCGAVTRAMKRLAAADVDPAAPLRAEDFFALRGPDSDNAPAEPLGEGLIPPLAALAYRNASRARWARAAIEDQHYVYRRLTRAGSPNPLGRVAAPLQATAVAFVHAHVARVAVCYMAIAALCLSVPLMRALSKNKQYGPARSRTAAPGSPLTRPFWCCPPTNPCAFSAVRSPQFARALQRVAAAAPVDAPAPGARGPGAAQRPRAGPAPGALAAAQQRRGGLAARHGGHRRPGTVRAGGAIRLPRPARGLFPVARVPAAVGRGVRPGPRPARRAAAGTGGHAMARTGARLPACQAGTL